MTSFETVAVSHRRMASVTRRQVCFIVSGAHRQVSKSRRRALALILRRVFEEGGFRIHVNAKWTLDARGVRASHSAHDSLIALDALADNFIEICDTAKIRLPSVFTLCMEYAK
jgi:hypothetical protein